MHKFVIWGVGRNGKELYEIIGCENIIAYIDKYTDRKEYNGIPIISINEYANRYNKIPVVISVDGQEDNIRKELSNYGKFICYDYKKEMDEIRKFSLQINKEKFQRKYLTESSLHYIGQGLFSLLVSNYFESKGRILTSVDMVKENTIDFQVVFNDKELFYHEEIEQLKDIHRGKRCFIIGNGPSLTYKDLNTLHDHNEICIGINGIFKAFDKTEWRPTYYVSSDPSCMFQWKNEILKMNVKYKIISDIAFYFNNDEKTDNLLSWHMYLPKNDEEKLKFSDNFAQISYNGDTVIYDAALQLAVYMGVDEVYLLGVDCTVSNNKKDHFVNNYQDKEFRNAKLNFDKHFVSYSKAKEYYDSHGIGIYNATRGGKLEIFKRVDFDSLF